MTDDLIARLRAEWPDIKDAREAADAIEAQAARIVELKAALKPFAEAAKNISDDNNDEMMLRGEFSVHYLRKACAVLEGKN